MIRSSDVTRGLECSSAVATSIRSAGLLWNGSGKLYARTAISGVMGSNCTFAYWRLSRSQDKVGTHEDN